MPSQAPKGSSQSALAPQASLRCILFSAIRHVKKRTCLEDFSCRIWQAWVGGSFDGQGLIIPFTLWHFLGSATLSAHSCQQLLSADASEKPRPADTSPHFCGLWGHCVALSSFGRHVDMRSLKAVRPRTSVKAQETRADLSFLPFWVF